MNKIADYTVTRTLGQGANSRVYEAVAPDRLRTSATRVAVKVFAHQTGAAEFDRVVEELMLYSAVAATTPELVGAYEVGRSNGRTYVATELCEGGSLSTAAAGLSNQQVVKLLIDAARGAEALHQNGLVHRAIKPTNVLIHGDGGRGCLTDIGLDHTANPGQTVRGLETHELAMVEPSLIRGERAERTTDVWSLGAVLHWALTGEWVYPNMPDGGLVDVLGHVISTPPTIAETKLSPALGSVVERCVHPHRSERYQRASDLGDHLEEILERVSA